MKDYNKSVNYKFEINRYKGLIEGKLPIVAKNDYEEYSFEEILSSRHEIYDAYECLSVIYYRLLSVHKETESNTFRLFDQDFDDVLDAFRDINTSIASIWQTEKVNEFIFILYSRIQDILTGYEYRKAFPVL